MIISRVLDICYDNNTQDLLSTVLALSTVSSSFHAHILHITQRLLAALHHDCSVVWTDKVRVLFRDTFLSSERYDACKHSEEEDVRCGMLLAQAAAPSHPWKHLYCGECFLERYVLQPRLSRLGDFYRRRINADAAYFGLSTLRCLLALRKGVHDIKVTIGDTNVEQEGNLVVFGGRVGF